MSFGFCLGETVRAIRDEPGPGGSEFEGNDQPLGTCAFRRFNAFFGRNPTGWKGVRNWDRGDEIWRRLGGGTFEGRFEDRFEVNWEGGGVAIEVVMKGGRWVR